MGLVGASRKSPCSVIIIIIIRSKDQVRVLVNTNDKLALNVIVEISNSKFKLDYSCLNCT